MSTRRLAVEGRQVNFFHSKKCHVLNDLNIHVPKGAIYGLLGPSGCGKTTLLRCMVGLLHPKNESIRIFGRKPGEDGFCIPGKGVGYMPQEIALCLDISIEETLWYFGQLYHMSSAQVEHRISFLNDLLKIPDNKSLIKTLSGGQKRRVSFATALIHKPPLLILDEPTVGVDPVLRQNIWDHLKMIANKDHMTIIITTHYVDEARQAQTVGLMRGGRLLAEMDPEKLMEMHDAVTLEEVFLKLSLADADSNLLTSISTETIMTTVEPSLNSSQNSLSTISENKIKNDFEQFNNKIVSFGTNNLSKYGNIIGLTGLDDNSNMLMYHTERRSEKWKKSLSRVKTTMKKSFIQLRRNIPLTTFQLAAPVLQVLMYCMVVGRDLKHLPLAVVNLDTETNISSQFLQKFDANVIDQTLFANLSLAIDSVKNGESWGALYIGPNFTAALMERYLQGSNIKNETIIQGSVRLYMDMTNQQINFVIQAVIFKSFLEFAEELLIMMGQNPLLAKSPIVIEEPIYGSKDTSFSEFMVPNIIIGISYFMAIGLTAMTILIEKKEGLIDRAMVAGVQFMEILLAITSSMFFVMVLQVLIMLSIIFAVFDITILGSIFWVTVCTLMAGISGMSLGLLISSACDSEYTAVLITMSVYTPNFIFSGIIWPIEAMTYYLRYMSYGLPLTFLADTMRSVISRGWGITDHDAWLGILVPSIWTIMSLLLSAIIFKLKN